MNRGLEGPGASLAPRDVGELLTEALALLRRELGAVVLMALPYCVLELFLREGAAALLAALRGLLGPGGSIPEERLSEAPSLAAGYFGLLLASVVVSQLLGASAVLVGSSALLGQRLSAVELLLGGLRRIVPVGVTLAVWLCALTAVVFVVPGLLAAGAVWLVPEALVAVLAVALWGLVALVGLVFLGLRWALWLPVVMLEGLSGPKALARSRALMASRGGGFSQGPKFRLSVLLLVYLASASGLQSLFAMPMLIQGFTQSPPFSDLSLGSMSVGWIVPLAALQVATNAVILPFNGVMTTLFYFDVRVRYEGFDLGEDEEVARG